MAWFKKSKYSKIVVSGKKDIPNGIVSKCPGCNEMIISKQLEENKKVCPKCQYHFRLNYKERLRMLLKPDSFQELFNNMGAIDSLDFPEYKEKLNKSKEKTGINEAVVTGKGRIGEHDIAIGVTDFNFMGASMGSVVGEKVTLLTEYAITEKLPLIVIIASGGARMQEGMLSLMQMAKTSSALAKLSMAGLPYIAVLTDPTSGGVTASFGMLGDIIIAEPNALICFAGPRVIEQTIKQRLPKGFQRSEFLLEHGMIDMIVHRKDLKDNLIKTLNFFDKKTQT